MARSFDSFGASRFPLAAVDGCAINLDPGLEAIASLLCAAVEADCGNSWRKIISELEANSFLAESTGPIGSVLTMIPTPQNCTQMKSTWPVLAIYREGEPVVGSYSLDYRNLTQRWSIDWICGPLGPDTQRKVGHFWVKVRDSMLNAIIQGMHPAYDSGKYQFHGQFAEIWPTDSAGPAVSDTLTTEKGAGYFGGMIIIQTIERQTFQNNVSATESDFDGSAYLTPNDGYGDKATGADVVVNFENKTPDGD